MAAGAGQTQNPSIARSAARPDMARSDGTRPDTTRLDAARPAAGVSAARRHRAELQHSIASFERALDVPAGDPDWRREVDGLLRGLREAFREHVAVTEGPEGLYGELVNHAPRLARGIDGLKREHADLLARMEGLHGRVGRPDPTVEQVRRWASELLDELWQHRQRGADLVYEAYATDIGGET